MTFVSHQRHLPIFFKKCVLFFQSISIYIVKGGFIMNEVNQVTIIFTQIKHNSEGKVVEHKRRFSNINPLVSNDQIKSFRLRQAENIK